MQPDCVIDANLLVNASARVEDSRTHLPAAALEAALNWLLAFRTSAAVLVLDDANHMMSEYRKNLTSQDLSMVVLREVLQSSRFRAHHIEVDKHGVALLPSGLESIVHDDDDRKFVAVALADDGGSRIAHGCDSDWYDCEEALLSHGVEILHVLDSWCRPEWERKRARSAR